jgi:gluconolactonase
MRLSSHLQKILLLFFFWPVLLIAQTGDVIAPGAALVKLAEGFTFTEGPAVDWPGNIFFTDQPNNRIYKWGIDQKLSIFLEPSGRANGQYFDRNGNLLACADEKGELWQITPSGQVSVLVNNFDGKLLNGPNDLWVRPDNALYFTDPYYYRSYWPASRTMEQEVQGVYFLSSDRRNLTRVISDLIQPNGIIGTPDGKTLYVADIDGNLTFAYNIHPDG